jgi:hypothetical protein
VFARYLAQAEDAQDSPRMAVLEALRFEVLEAIAPEIQVGGVPRP